MSAFRTIILFTILGLMTGCISEQADSLYPSNDAAAQDFYNASLKEVIDNKCISCHIYHLEGNNRYDNFEKTKSNIVQMLDRINSNSNTVMPPADAPQLTDVEKNLFQEFLTILNSETVEDVPEKSKIQITWTAYKYPDFNNRSGVSGTFDEVTYQLNKDFETPIDILKDAEVIVNTGSVNVGGSESLRTQNVLRFFTAFTPEITGKITNYTQNRATIEFVMNNVKQSYAFEINNEEDKLILTGKIPNMNRFNWQAGYDALEKVCGELHQNKVWEDVDVSIEILLE